MRRNPETNLQAEMLADISRMRLPCEPVLWRNNTGQGRFLNDDGSTRYPEGVADMKVTENTGVRKCMHYTGITHYESECVHRRTAVIMVTRKCGHRTSITYCKELELPEVLREFDDSECVTCRTDNFLAKMRNGLQDRSHRSNDDQH